MKSEEGPTISRGLSVVPLALLVFLLVYNISFRFAPSVSTARIALPLMFGAIWWINAPRIQIMERRIYLIFLLVPYVFVQFILVHDFGQLGRFLYLATYSFLGAWCAVRLAGTPQRFTLSLFIAILMQAIIIMYSFLSPTYRAWVDAYVVDSANFDATNIYRAAGLSGTSGSSLSVVQSMGIFCGWILLRRNDRLGSKTKLGIVLSMLIIIVSCVVVGRTGLILGGIFFALAAFNLSITSLAIGAGLIVGGFLFAATRLDLLALLPEGFSTDFFVKWAFGFLSGNDPVFRTLLGMRIPPLTSDTIFGTGLVSLVNGANPSGHDSGFVQTYYSIGLLPAIVFYALYLFVLFRLLNWAPSMLRVGLTVLFFSLEIKEPFLFKYVTMFVLVAQYHCHRIDAGDQHYLTRNQSD